MGRVPFQEVGNCAVWIWQDRGVEQREKEKPIVGYGEGSRIVGSVHMGDSCHFW